MTLASVRKRASTQASDFVGASSLTPTDSGITLSGVTTQRQPLVQAADDSSYPNASRAELTISDACVENLSTFRRWSSGMRRQSRPRLRQRERPAGVRPNLFSRVGIHHSSRGSWFIRTRMTRG